MKRVLFILLIALGASALACVVAYKCNMQVRPEEWVAHRLSLRGKAREDFTAVHNRYAATCEEMCARIRESDEQLSRLILSSSQMTPEIEAAMARSDALRNECRRNMLAHFYEVASLLEPGKREAYLQMVMPLIVEPGLMSGEHQPK